MIRIFVPTKRFIGQTTIETKIKHYTWSKGKGVWCTFIDGVKIKSAYNLDELTSKKDLTGLHLRED